MGSRIRIRIKSFQIHSSLVSPFISEFPPHNVSLGTPLTGIEFRKRLPCGEAERARKAIRTFLLLRQLSLSLQALPETSLPLLSPPDATVTEGDLLDLNNSGQLLCCCQLLPIIFGEIRLKCCETEKVCNRQSLNFYFTGIGYASK